MKSFNDIDTDNQRNLILDGLKGIYNKGFSWEQLAELSGYNHGNSLKNKCNGNADPKIEAFRFAMLLRGLSKSDVLELHHLVLDGSKWRIAPQYPKPSPEDTSETALLDAYLALSDIHRCVEHNDLKGAESAMVRVERFLAVMGSELKNAQSVLYSMEDKE